MNGTMIAIGGYNGLTNLYDVFTGKFIREISIKYPTRFQHMHNSLVPITSIQLNPNQIDNNGIIICGDNIFLNLVKLNNHQGNRHREEDNNNNFKKFK